MNTSSLSKLLSAALLLLLSQPALGQQTNRNFMIECLHQDMGRNANNTLFVFYTASKNELVIQTTVNKIKTSNYIAEFDDLVKPSHSISNLYGHIDFEGMTQKFNVFLNETMKVATLSVASIDLKSGYLESASSTYYKTCSYQTL